mmetsp:Transcript_22161/g.63538  ORF Transcript_22161/g.63538 Transcript_22161/m.63538 type:complete len:200 (-) Transcript_22161:44-643(-)
MCLGFALEQPAVAAFDDREGAAHILGATHGPTKSARILNELRGPRRKRSDVQPLTDLLAKVAAVVGAAMKTAPEPTARQLLHFHEDLLSGLGRLTEELRPLPNESHIQLPVYARSAPEHPSLAEAPLDAMDLDGAMEGAQAQIPSHAPQEWLLHGPGVIQMEHHPCRGAASANGAQHLGPQAIPRPQRLIAHSRTTDEL